MQDDGDGVLTCCLNRSKVPGHLLCWPQFKRLPTPGEILTVEIPRKVISFKIEGVVTNAKGKSVVHLEDVSLTDEEVGFLMLMGWQFNELPTEGTDS